MKSILEYLIESEQDYKMDHEAPNSSDGNSSAPLYDVYPIYPMDIYTDPQAGRLYGENDGDSEDNQNIQIIRSCHNRPNKIVRIYRSVPDLNKDVTEKIKELNSILNYYFRFRFFPMNNKIVDSIEEKYKHIKNYDESNKAIVSDISNQIDDLKSQKEKPLKINPGDWVSLNRNYVKEHGQSNLNNKFKIISKAVRAKDVWTDGNSLNEFGYDPQ